MILLISDTPVAGTVVTLASWIEKLTGQKTIALIKKNYAHHAFDLPYGTFGCMPNWEGYIAELVKQSTCIVLHNVLDEKVINITFREKRKNVNVIYQLHSPPLEGPQFTYNVLSKYKFDAIFSVSQGHGRFIKNSIPVPNIVKDLTLNDRPEKQNLVFVPHIRTTNFRWSNKFSSSDARELNESQKIFSPIKIATIKSLFGRDVVSHSEIQFALQFCSFVIDDINTGLMHQTATEALKAGCGVFSGADMFTVEEYCSTIEAPEPPFIYVNNVLDISKFLMKTNVSEFMEKEGREILDYSNEYLGEERLAKIYLERLEPYLN